MEKSRPKKKKFIKKKTDNTQKDYFDLQKKRPQMREILWDWNEISLVDGDHT